MNNTKAHPDFTKIPKHLFWDTNFDTINWQEKFVAVILRVFERGNDESKEEIRRFYSKKKINEALSKKGTEPYRLYANVSK